MPIHMRLPKLKGFKNRFKVEFQVVNVDRLGRALPGRRHRRRRTSWSRPARSAAGSPVKVLGTGDLAGVKSTSRRTRSPTRPREKITAAGGSVTDAVVRVGRWPGEDRPATGCYSRSLRSACPHRPATTPLHGAGGSVLSAFASAFRTPDLRKKLLFTLAMIAVYRLGSNVPTPNVSTANINACLEQASAGASARPLLAGQPVQRRRAAAAVGVRARASCRTSRRASSCSCWWW